MTSQFAGKRFTTIWISVSLQPETSIYIVVYATKKDRSNSKPDSRHLNQIYRNKRTYKDFEFYMEHHPDASVVELDTVKGTRTSGKCLMTLLFRSCNFMIIILLQKCTQECVINAINNLYKAITPILRTFPRSTHAS